MKIDEIDITKFGKLDNCKIHLKNGINLIEGNNESGKSTIEQFIFSSFFGFYKFKKNGVKEVELWKPWNESVFFGRLKYTLENNESFIIERDFNKKNPEIYDKNLKDITDRYLRNKTNIEILEEQIGINEEVFKNAVIGKQNAIILSDEDKNSLIHKIINKTTSGNENISINIINKKLSDRLRDEIGTNQTKAKPINLVEEELLKLYSKKSQHDNIAIEKIKIEKNIDTVRERFSSSSEKLKLIEKIKEQKNEFINEKKIIETLKQNLEGKKAKQEEKNDYLIAEYNKNIENIKRKAIEEQKIELLEKNNEYKIKNKKEKNKLLKYIITFLVFIFLIIIFNMIYKYKNFIGLNFKQYINVLKSVKIGFYCNIGVVSLFIFLNLIFFIIDLVSKDKIDIENTIEDKVEETENILSGETTSNQEIQENDETDFIKSQIDYINKDLENDKQNIMRREELLKAKEKEKDFVILKEYSSKIDSKYIKSLLLMNDSKLIAEEGMLKQIYDKSLYSLSQLETEKNEINKKENLNLELDEEIRKLEDEKERLLEYREIINISQKILEDANDELKEILDPNFINVLNKIIIEITNGKYSNVNIANEKEIYAQDNEKNKIVNIKCLSAGTMDQFNLAFRLAVIMNICDEKLPIILDEAFSIYDNIRLKNILKYFEKISKDRQIILFSSNDREQKILEKENIKFNYIKI